MTKIVCDMSMTLDGYIARRDGDDGGLHSWVFEGIVPVTLGGTTFHLTSEQSAVAFSESISNAGAYIMGSRTFVAGAEKPLSKNRHLS